MTDLIAPPLAGRILQALMAVPAGRGVSLPRLVKVLELSGSAIMRELALMGDAAIGGRPGPGWVHLAHADGRWVASITSNGRVEASRTEH